MSFNVNPSNPSDFLRTFRKATSDLLNSQLGNEFLTVEGGSDSQFLGRSAQITLDGQGQTANAQAALSLIDFFRTGTNNSILDVVDSIISDTSFSNTGNTQTWLNRSVGDIFHQVGQGNNSYVFFADSLGSIFQDGTGAGEAVPAPGSKTGSAQAEITGAGSQGVSVTQQNLADAQVVSTNEASIGFVQADNDNNFVGVQGNGVAVGQVIDTDQDGQNDSDTASFDNRGGTLQTGAENIATVSVANDGQDGNIASTSFGGQSNDTEVITNGENGELTVLSDDVQNKVVSNQGKMFDSTTGKADGSTTLSVDNSGFLTTETKNVTGTISNTRSLEVLAEDSTLDIVTAGLNPDTLTNVFAESSDIRHDSALDASVIATDDSNVVQNGVGHISDIAGIDTIGEKDATIESNNTGGLVNILADGLKSVDAKAEAFATTNVQSEGTDDVSIETKDFSTSTAVIAGSENVEVKTDNNSISNNLVTGSKNVNIETKENAESVTFVENVKVEEDGTLTEIEDATVTAKTESGSATDIAVTGGKSLTAISDEGGTTHTTAGVDDVLIGINSNADSDTGAVDVSNVNNAENFVHSTIGEKAVSTVLANESKNVGVVTADGGITTAGIAGAEEVGFAVDGNSTATVAVDGRGADLLTGQPATESKDTNVTATATNNALLNAELNDVGDVDVAALNSQTNVLANDAKNVTVTAGSTPEGANDNLVGQITNVGVNDADSLTVNTEGPGLSSVVATDVDQSDINLNTNVAGVVVEGGETNITTGDQVAVGAVDVKKAAVESADLTNTTADIAKSSVEDLTLQDGNDVSVRKGKVGTTTVEGDGNALEIKRAAVTDETTIAGDGNDVEFKHVGIQDDIDITGDANKVDIKRAGIKDDVTIAGDGNDVGIKRAAIHDDVEVSGDGNNLEIQHAGFKEGSELEIEGDGNDITVKNVGVAADVEFELDGQDNTLTVTKAGAAKGSNDDGLDIVLDGVDNTVVIDKHVNVEEIVITGENATLDLTNNTDKDLDIVVTRDAAGNTQFIGVDSSNNLFWLNEGAENTAWSNEDYNQYIGMKKEVTAAVA